MTKGRNFDNFGASTLPNPFSDASSESLQVMAANLMQAVQEAQGLLSDSLNGMDFRPPCARSSRSERRGRSAIKSRRRASQKPRKIWPRHDDFVSGLDEPVSSDGERRPSAQGSPVC